MTTTQMAPEQTPQDSRSDTRKDPEIVLCPGQGAQHVGMGKEWFDRSAAARKVYAMADEALGFELGKLCFEGPVDTLNRTDMAQIAIYTTSVACHAGLVEAEELGPLATAAGLSLGEFTALHLAGAFDFTDGLKLVRLRGQAMQDAAENAKGGSGMVALIGADEDQAAEICRRALSDSNEGVLVPANYNCPGQIVLSGSESMCGHALGIAQKMGLRATPLKVAGAFHSPLMEPAAQRLAEALDQVQWGTLTAPVLSNVTAQPHPTDNPQSIKTQLVAQLTSPVRWTQSMQWLAKAARGRYVELAPGKVLSGLMKRIDRGIKMTNFATPGP